MEDETALKTNRSLVFYVWYEVVRLLPHVACRRHEAVLSYPELSCSTAGSPTDNVR